MRYRTNLELHQIAVRLPGWRTVELSDSDCRPVFRRGLLFRRVCDDGSEPQRVEAFGPLTRDHYWYPKEYGTAVLCDCYTGRYVLQVDNPKTSRRLGDLLRPFGPVRDELRQRGHAALWRRFVRHYLYTPETVGTVAIDVAAALGRWPTPARVVAQAVVEAEEAL